VLAEPIAEVLLCRALVPAGRIEATQLRGEFAQFLAVSVLDVDHCPKVVRRRVKSGVTPEGARPSSSSLS
jgi:hypothetical protein